MKLLPGTSATIIMMLAVIAHRSNQVVSYSY